MATHLDGHTLGRATHLDGHTLGRATHVDGATRGWFAKTLSELLSLAYLEIPPSIRSFVPFGIVLFCKSG